MKDFINPTRPGKDGRAEGPKMGTPAYNSFARPDTDSNTSSKGVLEPEVPGRAMGG